MGQRNRQSVTHKSVENRHISGENSEKEASRQRDKTQLRRQRERQTSWQEHKQVQVEIRRTQIQMILKTDRSLCGSGRQADSYKCLFSLSTGGWHSRPPGNIYVCVNACLYTLTFCHLLQVMEDEAALTITQWHTNIQDCHRSRRQANQNLKNHCRIETIAAERNTVGVVQLCRCRLVIQCMFTLSTICCVYRD